MRLFSRSSDAHAADLLRQLPVGVAVYRMDDAADAASFRIVYANAAAEAATGLSAADVVGRRLSELSPDTEASGRLKVFAAVVRSGEPARLGVVPFRLPDGREVQFASHVVPLPDRSVGVVFEDVSDREALFAYQQAHQVGEREVARYRALVEATAAVVWQTPASGRFETDQPQWRAVTGQTEDELMGWGWLDAIHPDDQAATKLAWETAVRGRRPYDTEHRLLHADGAYRRMHVRAVPIVEDAMITEWVGVHTDVEHERAAASALAESGQSAQAIIDAISDVVLVYPVGPDGAGRLLAFNQAALDTYGYAAESLATMTVAELVDADRINLQQSLDELMRRREGRFDSVHVTRDGRRIPMDTSARLFQYQGQLCVLAVSRDDTDRRAFQRQMSRDNLELERRVADRTAELEAFAEDLKLLHAITTAEHPSVDALMQAYLTAGCEMFEMPIGILSAVENDPASGEPIYRIAHVVSPGDAVPAGLAIPLRDAFCDAVVASQDTVTYADAAEVEALSCHSAYAERGLRSFIGTPIWDGETLVGTLNFVSPEPRAAPFAPAERELAEVMADAVGTRLVQERDARARADADALHRSVLAAASDGIYGLDPGGRTTFVNAAAVALTGWSEAEQVGLRQHDLIHHHRPDGSPYPVEGCPVYRTLRDGVARDVDDEVFWHKDGSAVPVTYTVTPIAEDGDTVRGAVVVFRRRAADAPVASLPAIPLPGRDAHAAPGATA